MLKEKNYLFQRLNQLLDVLLIIVAFFAAHWARNTVIAPNFLPTLPVISVEQHHWLIWFMAALILLAQQRLGVYNSQRVRTTWETNRLILASVAMATAVTLGLVMVGPGLRIISKPQVVFLGLIVAALLLIKASLMKRFFLPSAAVA